MTKGHRLLENNTGNHLTDPINGVLVGNRIIVWDIDSSRVLFGNGYFGKPLGIAKPKGTQFSHPLVLDLIEGYYLTSKSRLVIRTKDSKPLSVLDMKSVCRSQYDGFDTK